jgi:hypothetical protein
MGLRRFTIKVPAEVLVASPISTNKTWYTAPAIPYLLKDPMAISEKWLVADPFTLSGAKANTIGQHFAKMFRLYIFHCPNFTDRLDGRSILIVNHAKVTID